MILTMQYPTTPYKVSVELTDSVLVFDGTSYVRPENASYVEVLLGFMEAYTPEFDVISTDIQVQHKLLLKVLGVDLPGEVPTVININEVTNPSPDCQCGITCLGLQLSYVTVDNDPPDPPFEPPEHIPNPGTQSGSSTGDCSCDCKPCCSPVPEYATHIRCEFDISLGWFRWF